MQQMSVIIFLINYVYYNYVRTVCLETHENFQFSAPESHEITLLNLHQLGTITCGQLLRVF